MTPISDKFMEYCNNKGVVIEAVTGKPGLYMIRKLIPVYIMVIDGLAFDEVYVQLLKYTKDLKRLVNIVSRRKKV